jgi:hypothetical protein
MHVAVDNAHPGAVQLRRQQTAGNLAQPAGDLMKVVSERGLLHENVQIVKITSCR